MKKYKTVIFIACLFSMASLTAQDSFFDGSDMISGENDDSTKATSSRLDISGNAQLGIRFYPHKDIKQVTAMPSFALHLKYAGTNTELDSHLKLKPLTIKEYPWDVLDEFTMRAFLGDFVLSAGKMKVVWGRGDKLHVLDVFNANDFTDFIIPDYIDRRLGEPMVHLAYNAPIPLKLELAWAPTMTPDRIAEKGIWVPAQREQMQQTLINMVAPVIGLVPSQFKPIVMPLIENVTGDFLPNTKDIKYGQYGLRLTGSAGPTDMGFQYYYGHYKTPSLDAESMKKNVMKGNFEHLPDCVYYDPLHIFGVDFGAAVAMFNFRSEFAYYMTYDFKGDDPAVHNNSIQWVLGFDVDIPLNNLNLNVQNIGSYTIGFNKVKDNHSNGMFDMDWNTSEKSTANKLVVNISDSWLNERLSNSVTVMWGIENNDVIIMPNIKYKIKDEFYIEGKGCYFYAENKKSEFSHWKNNHFIQLSAEYHF